MNKPKIVQFVSSLAWQTTLFCFFASIAMGQTTELSNLTSAEINKRLNALYQDGYRPVKIWSKQLGTIDSAGAKFGY